MSRSSETKRLPNKQQTCSDISLILNMEAVCSSEKLVSYFRLHSVTSQENNADYVER